MRVLGHDVKTAPEMGWASKLDECLPRRLKRELVAHPGEAPLTDYNLLSFFSDIIEIVLKNPKFA